MKELAGGEFFGEGDGGRGGVGGNGEGRENGGFMNVFSEEKK